MILTSFNRVKNYIGLTGTSEDVNVKLWLASASVMVEKYIDRFVESTSRTEYFDSAPERKEYFPKAIPVTTLTSVYEDSTGLWDGDESEIEDSYIGTDSRSVVLDYSPIPARKGLRIIYTGGLAIHGVNSVFAVGTITGTWTVGKYAIGGTSGAVGIIKTVAATALTIENIYGIFESGETLTEYDSATAQGTSDGTAIITAVTSRSLAEAYPDIVAAVEIQIREMWKHKSDFENRASNKDSTERWDIFARKPSRLVPEALELLRPYKRVYIA